MSTTKKTNKTKAELQQEIKELQEKVDKLERFETYADGADEMAAMVEAYENAGFSRDEAMQMVIALLGVASKFVRPSLF
jgi:uncharacterized protein YlxW (UPF0749 family)